MASPAAGFPGEQLKKRGKETRIKPGFAVGWRKGPHTPAFYTLGCNYITAEIFLCATGTPTHTRTHSPAHIWDIIRA